MTRFDELLAAGRALTKEQRAEQMKRLLASPFAPLLLVTVREQWEEFARAVSRQEMAAHHNCMEHCAGSMHAIERFENVLRSAIKSAEKPPKGR